MDENIKPKRVMTPEQLEKLAKAREKANEVRMRNIEIKKIQKEKERFDKEQAKIEKEAKQEQAYNADIEIKNKMDETKSRAPKPKPEPDARRVSVSAPEPEPDAQRASVSAPEPELETENETEIEEEPEPVKKVFHKKPIPNPRHFIRTQRSRIPVIQPQQEEELYSNASIEMLRHQFYQQTRQRLHNDLFGY